MLPADIFLALRYFKPKRSVISLISLLTLLGPTLGVTILIVVMAIMSGFDREIRRQLISYNSHFNLISSYRGVISDPYPILEKLDEKGYVVAPLIEGPILIQQKKGGTPKFLRGIDPERENKLLNHELFNLASGRKEVKLKHGEIILGDTIAQELGVMLGDKLLIHSPEKLARNFDVDENTGGYSLKEEKEVYLPEEVTVVDIFNTGFYPFDSVFTFLHIDQAAELFGLEWGSATSIHGNVDNPFDMTDDMVILSDIAPTCIIERWQDRNREHLEAVEREIGMMFFVLSFIDLIAAFSICCVMLTVVIQKTREIGIMKAMGFTPMAIARIFVLQGFLFGLIGSIIGTGLGLYIVEKRDLVARGLSLIVGSEAFPAALYQLDELPAYCSQKQLFLIFTMSVILCTLASFIPAYGASLMQPARALQENN